jgi:hypothetical protein
MSWQDAAACKGLTDIFFPSEHQDRNLRQHARVVYAEARQVCMTCTVRAQCLEQAFADRELDYGMFGGMSPPERRRIARQDAQDLPPIRTGPTAKAVAECGTPAGYKRHLANGEPTCGACRHAASTYRRQWRVQQRKASTR